MLIAYHDKYGCDCYFDSDLASPQELIEFAAESPSGVGRPI
jgi:hypothetical protein